MIRVSASIKARYNEELVKAIDFKDGTSEIADIIDCVISIGRMSSADLAIVAIGVWSIEHTRIVLLFVCDGREKLKEWQR